MLEVVRIVSFGVFQRGERIGWTFSPLRPARTHLL